jgi:hypothetical protein
MRMFEACLSGIYSSYLTESALRYWLEGLGIDPQWCRWGFFSYATDGTVCPGVDSASKKEYQVNSWGWRRAVRKGNDLTTFIVPNVEKIQEP